MSKRINIHQLEPAFTKAMMGLVSYLHTSGISNTHIDLINIRASQINGCAYCLNMHTKEASAHGETQQRINTLAAWRDTTFFTDEERAILALTEEVTHISNRVSDETYDEAARLFDEHYLAKIIIAITTINSWNRISVSTHTQPAKD